MAERPILFVAGLGRCGTTMVMNMLAPGRIARPVKEIVEEMRAAR